MPEEATPAKPPPLPFQAAASAVQAAAAALSEEGPGVSVSKPQAAAPPGAASPGSVPLVAPKPVQKEASYDSADDYDENGEPLKSPRGAGGAHYLEEFENEDQRVVRALYPGMTRCSFSDLQKEMQQEPGPEPPAPPPPPPESPPREKEKSKPKPKPKAATAPKKSRGVYRAPLYQRPATPSRACPSPGKPWMGAGSPAPHKAPIAWQVDGLNLSGSLDSPPKEPPKALAVKRPESAEITRKRAMNSTEKARREKGLELVRANKRNAETVTVATGTHYRKAKPASQKSTVVEGTLDSYTPNRRLSKPALGPSLHTAPQPSTMPQHILDLMDKQAAPGAVYGSGGKVTKTPALPPILPGRVTVAKSVVGPQNGRRRASVPS